MAVTKRKSASENRQARAPRKQKVIAEEIAPETQEKRRTLFSNLTSYRPSKISWIIIIAVGLLILFSTKKGLLLAATVNGVPITNLELLSRLNQQYHSQMLNQIVNEKLILGEAQKNGVTISSQEINDKISELEKNVGGAQALDSLLSQQNQSRPTLRDQLKIQLIVEKLYAKDATVSAEEVDKFITQNKDSLQATDSAGQTKEATDALKQQKLGKAFNERFQQLKQQAKIQIF